MYPDLVPMGLFDRFSPAEAIKKLFEGFEEFFSGSAVESIEDALRNLADGPLLDPSDKILGQEYGGALALSLVLGSLGLLLWIYRAVKYQDVESWVTAAKIIPMIIIIGGSLPYFAYVASTAIQKLNAGLVEWFTGAAVSKDSFQIALPNQLPFVTSIIGWIGGKLLDTWAEFFGKFLPYVVLLVCISLGLRWLGILGDRFFVFLVGLLFTCLFSGTAIIVVLGGFFWLARLSPVEPGATMLVFSIFCAALAPFGLLIFYMKSNMSTRVSGVMESRVMSNQIASSSASSNPSGGLSSRAYVAGAGAVAGALVARSMSDGRPDDLSRSDHMRQGASRLLTSKALLVAKTNPMTAIASIAAARVVQPKPKPNPSKEA